MRQLLTTARLSVTGGATDWRFQYRDGDGDIIATGAQVAGEQPPHGWRRWLSTNHNLGRIVVRVDDAAGTPLFFADREPVPRATAFQPPCAIVAPDGTLMGRVTHDTATWARSFLDGRKPGPLPLNSGTFHKAHRIVDARDQVLYDVRWEQTSYRPGGGETADLRVKGGRHCDFTAPDGTVAARYHLTDGLWFQRQLPHSAHTLVVAFPVALALMGAAYGM